VTVYNPAEMYAKDLSTYIANQQAAANTDVVVWYMGSIHHLVRRGWRIRVFEVWIPDVSG
jgi:Cu2+-containing amine oxidase